MSARILYSQNVFTIHKMLSQLRKDLLYSDTSRDIVEHDEDIDADLITIEGRDVYQGSIDPRFTSYNLDVHWLYDDSLKRVGLIEHESHDRTIHECLWFYDNPYATYLQEPGWTTTSSTIWSRLSNEAYQDCLENDFNNIVEMSLNGDTRIILPQMLANPITEFYECSSCQKRTLSAPSSCSAVKKISFNGKFYVFLDDSFVMYHPPPDSSIWSTLRLQHDGGEQEPQKPEQEQEQVPPQSSPQSPSSEEHLESPEKPPPHPLPPLRLA